MTENPRVSVIMIFLNAEKFVQEAIESVLVQTYDSWELVLVDDGSTDGSTSIARRYAEHHSGTVRYLEHDRHQNRGMSASRNLGICRSTGQYVAFLDADDVWLPHKLERQVALLDSQPEAAMVSGLAQWWYSWTGRPEDCSRDFIQRLDIQLDTLVKPPTLLILSLQDPLTSLCDTLVRRSVLEALGAFENSFRGMFEDQVFRAKLTLSFPAFVSSECLYRYRKHPEACTALSERAGQYYSTRQVFLHWLEEYLSREGAKGTEVWKVLQKELWSLRHPRLSRVSARFQRLLPRLP